MRRELELISQAWRERADELAQWTADALVNRQDLWGRYLPLNQRSPQRIHTTARGILNRILITQHYRAQDPGHLIGLHAISARNTSRWLAVSVDRSGPDDPTTAEDTRFSIMRWSHSLQALGFLPLIEDRNGAGGYVLWVLLDRPAPSGLVFDFVHRLVADYQWGLHRPPDIFPDQVRAEAGRLGKWISLPGCHPTVEHWSKVWSGMDWLSGAQAVDMFLRLPASPSALLGSPDSEPAIRSPEPAGPILDPGSDAGPGAHAPIPFYVPGSSAVRPVLSEGLRTALCGSGQSLVDISANTGVGFDLLSQFVMRESDLTLATADRLARYLGLALHSTRQEQRRSG